MRTALHSRLLVFGLLVLTLLQSSQAQDRQLSPGFVQEMIESELGILSNSISNLHASGDSLWVGPFLNFTVDEGQTWQVIGADSLFGTGNRLFSLDVDGGRVVAGLGRTDNTTGDAVQTAAGFLMSEDGGQNFDYRFPQLDQPNDNFEQYGVSTLEALPVIVPQQSPPFDIDFDPATGEVWVAGWASGIRRSSDMGRTWSRVVLPPDALDYIHPDSSYDFVLEPKRGGNGSLNHMGFAVLVDASGTIWAGTAGGVNRSRDGGLSWRKFRSDGTGGSLTGSWVISIEEQIFAGQSTIWMATWPSSDGPGGQFGVTYTTDGGETFRQALQGKKVYDFAFDGQTVYAAGDEGLFISRDGGIFWESIRSFQDREGKTIVVRPDESAFSIERTNSAIWLGTGDGLLRSADGGRTWELFRVNIPLHPNEPSERIPDVDAFAYPNPFSPAGDRFVRIRYELNQSSAVEIHIFDFGMSLIRSLQDQKPEGISETIWDGVDSNGARVANGTYFYEIRASGSSFRGKILVIE